MSGYRTATIGTLVALALSLALLDGCGGSGYSSGGQSQGQLTLSITDAPVDDATAVVVVFTGLELQPSGGAAVNIDFAAPKSIDLLTLRSGATGFLTQGAYIPAGGYQWMRLKVLADKNMQNESYITLSSGAMYPLYVPSGAETGLKLVRPFTVAQGSTTRLLVDFNLRKSVTAPPGQDPNYILRPTLKLMDPMQTGKLSVHLDLQALADAQLGLGSAVTSCKAGLYLYSGAMATPDDQDGDATDDGGMDPLWYQPVRFDGTQTLVTVEIPFVEAGSYTLAGTCYADVDAADTNDYIPNALSGQSGYRTMAWTAVNNVMVSANATTEVALP